MKNLSCNMASSTRMKTKIFLIGYPNEHITGCKLPTLRDILKTYVYKIQRNDAKKVNLLYQKQLMKYYSIESTHIYLQKKGEM